MGKQTFNPASGQFMIWGVIALGLYAALQAGNIIADDGYGTILISLGALIGLIAILTIRQFWWIPLFLITAVGFSTSVGFQLRGTDLAAMLALSALLAMVCMGQLKSKHAESNLGLFFYLLLLYVGAHAVLYGLQNYYSGDTQFKNIVKAYYGAFTPLLILWLMDRYAYEKGMKGVILTGTILSVIFGIVALVMHLTGYSLPFISGGTLDFSWAGAENAIGYLRWVILPFLMLAICMVSCRHLTPTSKLFYRVSISILIPLNVFGGGRVALISLLLFLVIWFGIRGKWQQVIITGWITVLAVTALVVMGHTIDSRTLQNMPESFKNVQRAVSIFLPADQQNEDQTMTEGSNVWHEDLVKGSWNYAMKEPVTMIFGNGYKGWDDSIDINMFTYGAAYESAVQMAIRMGASETMFFSALAIFGWLGVVLYYAFMIELLRRSLRVIHLCPQGTMARSLCEFSFCSILVTIIISPIGGAIPSYGLIYWMLGFIAAEPYLVRRVKSSRSTMPAIIPNLAPQPVS
jgi:hypothetical protein